MLTSPGFILKDANLSRLGLVFSLTFAGPARRRCLKNRKENYRSEIEMPDLAF